MNDEAREVILPEDVDVVGKTDYDIFSEDVAERFRAGDERVIEEEEPVELEEQVPTPEGECTFLMLKSPMTGPDGEVTGICAVSTDITERVEYEREVERQNERLNEFASFVSHDLQSPLNVARGRLDQAQSECASDHLDAVATAHERMATLIDDLLTWAKHGDPVTETEPVDLSDAVGWSWATVDAPNARLLCDTDLTVEADPGRFQQVLENLFRNAAEHADEPSPDVTVTVGECEGGIYVADDGPGIPVDERDQVFESGYTTAEDGTGFGLSIVRQIAEAHGWRIDLMASDSGGARFEITGIDAAS
jgi:signal transduction histidine kinase